MTTVRCPSCAAAIPADAAWCTLCFARLGAQPAPAPVQPAPAPVQPAASLPLSDPLAPSAAVLPGVLAVAEAPAPTWPCSGCDQRVALEEMTCPHCGTAFMGGVKPNVSLHVPGVGDLGAMSPGARFGVMAGGTAIVTIVLFLVALVLGHLL